MWLKLSGPPVGGPLTTLDNLQLSKKSLTDES